jgi:hypothetical protein
MRPQATGVCGLKLSVLRLLRRWLVAAPKDKSLAPAAPVMQAPAGKKKRRRKKKGGELLHLQKHRTSLSASAADSASKASKAGICV